MDDLLSFISKKLKQTDGLSMQSLVTQSGLTRSKFYRYMQEPHRFSEEELSTIAGILNLSQEDKKTLLQFKWGEQTSSKNENDESIHRFIFNNRSVELDGNSKSFTLFDDLSPDKTITKLSAHELATRFSLWVKQYSIADKKPKLNIRIINCVSKEKIKMIYSLLKELVGIEVCSRLQITTHHVIDSSSMELKDKFDALLDVCSLVNSSNYHVHFENLNGSVWRTMNCFIITCSFDNKIKVFMFALQPSDHETIIYAQPDQMLMDFLDYDCNALFSFESKANPYPTMFLNFNDVFPEHYLKTQKLVIEYELCYDNFSPELWSSVGTYITKDPEMLNGLRKYADPQNCLGDFDNTQFFAFLSDGCIRRYLALEATSSINVLSSEGLRYFVDNNGIRDFDVMNLKLPDELILRQLENIKERLGNHESEKKQSYYILDPLTRIKNVYLAVYRESIFYFFTEYDPQLIYLCSYIMQPEMSIPLYDYIVDELLATSKRDSFESPIMSDARANSFIDSLITCVKNRMVENSKR